MISNYDELRYGRDWRYGSNWTGPSESGNGSLERVWLIVFLTATHRRRYAEDQKLNGCHIDFLSEKEMACVIDAPSRQKVWEYFSIGNGDYTMVTELLNDGMIMIYGKADPAAFADDEKSQARIHR